MLTQSERAVIREVLIRGPMSRRDLGDRVELAAPSLTRLLRPFLASGLLVEVEESGERSVGRPVRRLEVAPGWGRFAGVKITGDRLHMALTDGRARVLETRDEALEDLAPAAVADRIVALLEPSGGLDGLGVSVGGVVEDGLVEDGVFLGWRSVDFARILGDRLEVPVVVENDVIALAEAHRWFGEVRDRAGFALITIGVGVGYGLVVNGRVVRSREAGMSLAAHVRLTDGGTVCPLGHAGCAAAVLSTEAVERRYAELGGVAAPLALIHSRAAMGDELARRVTGESADALGRFIALAANLSLQSTVVVAGDGVGVWGIEEARIREVVALGRDERAEALLVIVGDSGFGAWARGAAVVAIQSALHRLSPH